MLENIKIHTSTGVDLEFEPAGLGSRILAYLLDALILGAYIIAVSIFILSEIEEEDGRAAILIFLSLPLLLYHFLSETFMNGQSIGKQALKIQVIRLDGKQANAGNYALRSLLRLIEISSVQGSFAIISIVSTKFGQRLGDLAAGTTVVRVKRDHNLSEGLFRLVETETDMRYPEARQLDSRDAETIGMVLDNMYKKGTEDVMIRLAFDARKRLATRLEIETTDSDVKFLETLLADYNRYHTRA